MIRLGTEHWGYQNSYVSYGTHPPKTLSPIFGSPRRALGLGIVAGVALPSNYTEPRKRLITGLCHVEDGCSGLSCSVGVWGAPKPKTGTVLES